jgi:hypothetical protein
MELLFSGCDSGPLQPFCHRLADRLARIGRLSEIPPPRQRRKTKPCAGPVDAPRRPGLFHDFEIRGPVAGRPRRYQNTQPSLCLRPQPLRGSSLYSPAVPAWLPRPLGLPRRGPPLLSGVLLLVQPRASSLRPPTADTGGCSLRHSGRTPRAPTRCARCGLPSAPGTMRETTTAAPRVAGGGWDESACSKTGPNSLTFYAVCLILVDTFRSAASAADRPHSRPHAAVR